MSGKPQFARDYPADAALDRLVEAYQHGDYAHVRQHAGTLAEEGEEEAVRAAAADLRGRLDPPPLAAILWALGTALLVLLFGYYISQGH